MLSPYALPLHTLRLWGRCLLPLVIWYSLGQAGRFGLQVAGSELSHGSWREWRLVGVMLIFIVMVMLAMVVTVGMLRSLRGGLLEMRLRAKEGVVENEPFFTGLGRAIIAFVAVYLAWSWFVDDARQFADADMEHDIAQSRSRGRWWLAYRLQLLRRSATRCRSLPGRSSSRGCWRRSFRRPN